MLCIFPKMSEKFTDCQDFIQLQEQDFFRLKLQHALDLKVELITYKESFCNRDVMTLSTLYTVYLYVEICNAYARLFSCHHACLIRMSWSSQTYSLTFSFNGNWAPSNKTWFITSFIYSGGASRSEFEHTSERTSTWPGLPITSCTHHSTFFPARLQHTDYGTVRNSLHLSCLLRFQPVKYMCESLFICYTDTSSALLLGFKIKSIRNFTFLWQGGKLTVNHFNTATVLYSHSANTELCVLTAW